MANMDGCMTLILPWPPSVNNYWRRSPKGIYLTRAARTYREQVYVAVHRQYVHRMTGPLRAEVVVNWPTKQMRDLDNLEKSLWDALGHAGVFEDDSQICHTTKFWGRRVKGGSVEVTLNAYDGPVPEWLR